MKFKSIVLAAFLLATMPHAYAASTIDPTIPAPNAPLQSATIRGNFANAASDINNLLTQFAASSAPANPSIGQYWRQNNVTPNVVFQWTGSTWAEVATFDTIGNTITPYFGNALLTWQQLVPGLAVSGKCLAFTGTSSVPTPQNCVSGSDLSATAPLVSTPSGLGTTLSLSLDSNFAVNGSSQLALNSGAGNLVLATPNGSSGEPALRALVGADLPNPSPTTLGGIESFAAVNHQWINAISAGGVPSSTQPGFSDLSGSLAPSQCPNATISATGCVEGDNATLSLSSGVISINLSHPNTWSNQAFVAPALGAATATSLDIGGATLGGNAFAVNGSSLFSGAVVSQSASTLALCISLNGTNCGLQVDESTASAIAGLKIKGDVTGGTVNLSAIDSGSTTALAINARGSGSVLIGNSSTGTVDIGAGGGGLTVHNSFAATGLVTLADLVTGTQDTVVGYFGGTAASALSINNCSNSLTYSTTTHAFGCNTTAGTGTVTSITAGNGVTSSPNPITNTGTISLSLGNQLLNASPTATSLSTATQMFGMGSGAGACKITPAYSGRVRVTFDGNIENTTTATTTVNLATKFGTGTAPSGGGASAGTAIGGAPAYSLFAIGSFVPFSQTRIITGLTPGTAYWFDMSPTAISAGTIAVNSPNCAVEEID